MDAEAKFESEVVLAALKDQMAPQEDNGWATQFSAVLQSGIGQLSKVLELVPKVCLAYNLFVVFDALSNSFLPL